MELKVRFCIFKKEISSRTFNIIERLKNIKLINKNLIKNFLIIYFS